jgi:hypothetical protein
MVLLAQFQIIILDENIKLDRICNEIVDKIKVEKNLVNISINHLFREFSKNL